LQRPHHTPRQSTALRVLSSATCRRAGPAPLQQAPLPLHRRRRTARRAAARSTPAAFASERRTGAPAATPPKQAAAKVDTDLYHYLPAWLSPWTVALAGAALFGASVAAELSEAGGGEALGPRPLLLAAAPVAALLFLALSVVPRQFRAFAREYAREHPDVIAAEAAARARAESAEGRRREGAGETRVAAGAAGRSPRRPPP
jgi:hypothetical protein